MWRADLVRTRTGQRGARLNVDPGQQAPVWETNAIPTGSLILRRAEVTEISATWWEPLRNAIIMSHRHRETDEWTAILGGPITEHPTVSKTRHTIVWAGIERILQGRQLVHETANFATLEAWKRNGPWWSYPLGQIMWEALQVAQAKPHGTLPITHGTPTERTTGAVPGGRGWANWDLGNNNVWDDVLLGMSKEHNGPDLRFTPRWISDSPPRLDWIFEHGTHADPLIHHTKAITLDDTAHHSAVSDLAFTLSGKPTAHRAYATGAGEGPGTVVAIREDLALLKDEMPLIETTASDTSATDDATVAALAAGSVRPNPLGAWEATCKVMASPSTPLHAFKPGAPVRLKVSGFHPISDGVKVGRILKVGFDLKTDQVSLTIEEA